MRHPFLRKMVLTVAAMSIVTTGCFGSFQMTQNVYSWNKKIAGGNKWSQELVFLLIGPILPVYGVATFLDAVFVNSVEFWTGKNPMMSATKVIEKNGTKVVQTLRSDMGGRTQTLEVSNATGPVSTTTMFQATGSQLVSATTTYVDGRTETKSVTVDEAGAVVKALTKK
jgi:Tfp pilus assembly major pilin PilA